MRSSDPLRIGIATMRPFWAALSPRVSLIDTPSAPSSTQIMKLRSKCRNAAKTVGLWPYGGDRVGGALSGSRSHDVKSAVVWSAPRGELLADGGDQGTHLRRRRDGVRRHAVLVERERAGRPDRADDGAMAERVPQRRGPSDPRTDLKEVPYLHLAGERDRVEPAVDQLVDQRLDRLDVVGQAPLVRAELLAPPPRARAAPRPARGFPPPSCRSATLCAGDERRPGAPRAARRSCAASAR